MNFLLQCSKNVLCLKLLKNNSHRTYAKRQKRTECRHSRANGNPLFSKTCGPPLSRG